MKIINNLCPRWFNSLNWISIYCTAENNKIFSSTKYLAVENVDEKLKNADYLLNNCRFFICILNVGDVGVDQVKKNHSTFKGFDFWPAKIWRVSCPPYNPSSDGPALLRPPLCFASRTQDAGKSSLALTPHSLQWYMVEGNRVDFFP